MVGKPNRGQGDHSYKVTQIFNTRQSSLKINFTPLTPNPISRVNNKDNKSQAGENNASYQNLTSNRSSPVPPY